jgi:excinuclease UvrABC ATPase subunit
MQDHIVIRGARLHNLKGVSLSTPKGKLVVFTGLSGSGKSTLAFDTLHREAQRQYMESLGLVTHGLTKPAVESIRGLSPSISVDQHLVNHSPRSTVGTVTEVYTYLRVLYARIGHRPCPACGGDVPPAYDSGNGELWDDDDESEDAARTTPCPRCGEALPEIGMANFSFNKLAGACPTCTGLGVVTTANLAMLIDEPTTGLHPADVARLLGILQRLVDAGNSMLVIEHNLDVVKAADWVIDLGPEGGDAGGRVVAEGTPEQVAGVAGSHTGALLRPLLHSG